MTPMPPQVWVPATTCAILQRAVAQRPAMTALIAGDVRLDYQSYGRCVDALATRLATLGAEGGTVVTLLRNSIAAAVASFAIQRAGATVAALNPDYSARELAPMLGVAQPVVVLAHREYCIKLQGIVAPDAVLIPVDDDASFIAEWLGAPVGELPALEPQDIAVLQFTGGTTGAVKGVELSHASVAINVAQREAVLPTVFGDERVVCMMPMFHSFAAAMCLHLSAYAAGTLVILPRYRPDWVVDAVRDHGATRLPAGPTVFNGLLGYAGLTRASMASLVCAYSGSAPLASDTLDRWQEATGVPIYEGYGQSEAGPILTYQGPATGRRLRSVGPPVPLTEVRLGDDGEILARGPQVMRGYRGLAAESADAVADGWLHTGDIGHFDAEGHLFIDDRKKDMVLIGGYNVYPREIDEVLMLHPAVAVAACIGVPDAHRGERICAYVVAQDAPPDLVEALVAHCAEHLVRYKQPASIEIVDALPLTGVGKIDKVALRRSALSAAVTDIHDRRLANVA